MITLFRKPALFEPRLYMLCNLRVVHFLEHEVAVARNALVGKIDHCRVSAVGVVGFSKVASAIENGFPKRRGLDFGGVVFDVVAEVDYHRDFRREELLVFKTSDFGSSARLNRDDCGDVLCVRLPADSSSLRVRYVDGFLSRHFLNVRQNRAQGLSEEFFVIRSRVRCHLAEKLVLRLISRWELRAFVAIRNAVTLNELGEVAARYAQSIIDLHENMAETIHAADRKRHKFAFASSAPAPIVELSPIVAQIYMGLSVSSELLDGEELWNGLRDGSFEFIVSR